MLKRWVQGGEVVANWAATPSGLYYADGVFETMRVAAGTIPLWYYHRRRLARSLECLKLDAPDWKDLEASMLDLAKHHPEAVLKLVCCSSGGARGYLRMGQQVSWALQLSELPASHAPLRAQTASLRLAGGSALESLKGLARPIQRMAATEVSQAGCGLALLRHRDGDAVSFSHGNLYCLQDGRLWTPPLSRGAIAGIVRELLLRRGPLEVRVAPLDYARLFAADAVLVSNAVRGIQSVAAIDGRPLAQSGQVSRCVDWLRELGLDSLVTGSGTQ